MSEQAHEGHSLVIPTPANFPVEWRDPRESQGFWTRDRMHFPDQVTVLEADVIERVSVGMNRAFQRFGIPQQGAFRGINSYLYGSMKPTLPPDEAAQQEDRLQATMQAAVANLAQQWDTETLPEIQAHLKFWQDFDLASAPLSALTAHFEETLTRYERAWELHFLTVGPMMLPIGLFEEMYHELFPSDHVFDAYRLLEGLPNKTTASGLELWKLSRQALASPALADALSQDDTTEALAALDASEEGRAFRDELDRYLQEYGQRGDKWAIRGQSWLEDPTPVLNNLRDYMAQTDRDLVAEMQASARKREEAIEAARARLQGYPEPVVQQFEFLLDKAQVGNVLSEDHGYWIDFRCSHQVRMVLLEIGTRFADNGLIENRDDVFHLTLDDIRNGLAGTGMNLKSLVAQREQEFAHWGTVEPPESLGTQPPGPPPDNPMTRIDARFFGAPVEQPQQDGLIHGHAGSPGVVVGPARIIRSVTEAGILAPGDILVAETTAPPWTPLFGTVAAVVTDTGGILSHCAVVAREYGIPAVVGTGIATARIVDGQMLEVDGNQGIVRLLDTASV